ncbi:MAG: hypothetical protein KTR20_09570 [Cellvibrionaceae bacterium]|nr:hypothetical protein [Cellvibrionaceae bacterium]
MKTREQIVDAMLSVLSHKMMHPYIKAFQTDAKLIDDLALDSVLFLQFITFLELEHGLEMPETDLMQENFETIGDLAQILYQAQGIAQSEKGLAVYEDLKIHCVASCLSEIVKRHTFLDHRILYFGVWDAEVCISDDYVLTYHSQQISHSFFADWYEKIYGMTLEKWYDDKASKADNIATLIDRVDNRRADQHIMVMLDMFTLPERKNEFNKDPFPHYVMLGPTTDPTLWMVYDPDYRWEGVIAKDRIIHAVKQPTVSGGYLFSDADARPTENAVIGDYIDASVRWDNNPLTDAIRIIVKAHLGGCNKNKQALSLDKLHKALEELPVLQPRKYAYEHGFAFFWRELLLPEAEFDQLCEAIDELVKAYKVIHLQVMKLAATGNNRVANRIFQLLDQQDAREFALKKRLQCVYQQWLQATAKDAKTLYARSN